MNKTSVPRLRSVRTKNGASIHVLRTDPASEIHANAVTDAARLRETQPDLKGYVIFGWGDATDSLFCEMKKGNPYPAYVVPEWLKQRLRGYLDEARW